MGAFEPLKPEAATTLHCRRVCFDHHNGRLTDEIREVTIGTGRRDICDKYVSDISLGRPLLIRILNQSYNLKYHLGFNHWHSHRWFSRLDCEDMGTCIPCNWRSCLGPASPHRSQKDASRVDYRRSMFQMPSPCRKLDGSNIRFRIKQRGLKHEVYFCVKKYVVVGIL